MLVDIKTPEWDSVVSSKNLVAADFWAKWCPYCMRLKPILESVAKDYQDINFAMVNVQEEPDLARRYGIQGIPLIKFFCEGREVGEIVGYIPENELRKQIEQIANAAPSCMTNTSITK